MFNAERAKKDIIIYTAMGSVVMFLMSMAMFYIVFINEKTRGFEYTYVFVIIGIMSLVLMIFNIIYVRKRYWNL